MDVRVGLYRKLSTKELMLLNCDVGEDSWESLGLHGVHVTICLTETCSTKTLLCLHWGLLDYFKLLTKVKTLEFWFQKGGDYWQPPEIKFHLISVHHFKLRTDGHPFIQVSSSLFTSQARPGRTSQLPPFQVHMGNDSSYFLPEPSFLFPGSL